MEWEAVIGLEIHAQLATRSQDLLRSATTFGAEPNTQASLVDLGYPGVLPVLNREAVRMAVMFGLAIDAESAGTTCSRARTTSTPTCPRATRSASSSCRSSARATLDIALEDGTARRVGITRAHLEEDAGKSLHEDFQRLTGIDLNRAGTPLLEIVSEPDMRSRQGSRRLRQDGAHAGALPGHLRRQHAGRLVALRRQRLGASAGAGRASAPAPRSRTSTPSASSRGDQLRSRAPDRAARGRRQGDPGDAPVRPGQRRNPADAHQGGSQRLPLLPRSGPAAGRDRRRVRRVGARHPAGAAGRRRRRVSAASSASRPTTPAC